MVPPGPIFDHMHAVLSEFSVYGDYCAGRLTREAYMAGLEAHAAGITDRLGGSKHLYRLALRFPPDFDAEADEVLSVLLAKGLVSEHRSGPAFEAYREKLAASYDHGTNRTYILPDDARLLYFISMAVKPERMIVAGSYYGYWAAWAMPGVEAAGGEAVLLDPNAAVCALAGQNFRSLGYGARTTVHAKKAEDVFPTIAPGVDLVLLDAAGPDEHPDPAYRSKGIYGFLIGGIFEKMRDGALLVVHNDYMDGPGGRELEGFHAFCRANFCAQHVAQTPEGFGVYLK